MPLDLAVTKLTRLAASEAGYEQLVKFSNSLYNCYGWVRRVYLCMCIVRMSNRSTGLLSGVYLADWVI